MYLTQPATSVNKKWLFFVRSLQNGINIASNMNVHAPDQQQQNLNSCFNDHKAYFFFAQLAALASQYRINIALDTIVPVPDL